MSEHRHSTYQEWCYRCDVSRQESLERYARLPLWRRWYEHALDWWYSR